ncbi:MAG: hypothetical protein C0608_09100 [Deltaproteobacteria bacterium]|nr:MAG: hypothetical protein C0608_09100 [Deltaproteobacteria bacterium]
MGAGIASGASTLKEEMHLADKKSLVDRIYDFLCSIKLSIFVLVALAVTSIIGTVLQQGASNAEYVRDYGEAMGAVIRILNLGDMYHSSWFMILLALLLINITFCSIKRMPSALKLMKDKDPVIDGRTVATHEKWETTLKGKAEDVASRVEALMKKRAGKVYTAENDGIRYVMATKGGISRMGVYVTHFSLFLFAIGAVVGILFGFKAFMGVVEGTTETQVRMRSVAPIEVVDSSTITSREALTAALEGLTQKLSAECIDKDVIAGELYLNVLTDDDRHLTKSASFNQPTSSSEAFSSRISSLVSQINWDGVTPLKGVALTADNFFKQLDFGIRCDDFVLEKYPDGRPADYVSNLSVIRNGAVDYAKRIEVNHPLIEEGIYFYQSSYGQVGANSAVITVADSSRNYIARGETLYFGKPLELPDGGTLTFRNVQRDDRSGAYYLQVLSSVGGQNSMGRAFEANEFGGRYQWWQVGPYLVRVDSADWVFYTGLQVAKDPGVPIVWAGCILITIGLLASFFLSHKRVWARISESGGKVTVAFKGNASRNRISFSKWFEDFIEEVREDFEK